MIVRSVRVMGRKGLVGLALLVGALVSLDGGVGGSAAAQAAGGAQAGSLDTEGARPSGIQADPRRGFDLGGLVEEEGLLVDHVEDRTIVTTLDTELQRFAEALLRRYEVPDGAAVAINSRTGEVLVLAQHSERAPGRMVALAVDAPAASMFKVVTAAALLEMSDLGPDSEFCYHGGARRIQASHLVADPTRDRLCSSLSSAMGRSINVIFARLADRHLSAADLERYALGFGFNRDFHFDVPLEVASAEVPVERVERARMAAGFWHTHRSPLHAAVMAQVVAQDGALLRPYLIDEVRDGEGEIIYDASPEYLQRACSPETAEQLTEMMVTTTTLGTARSSFFDRQGRQIIQDVDVAGKTGTLHGHNPFRAFDWFMGFAPADDPEIAVAGLVINDPRWRIKGHFVARELLRQYFRQQRRSTRARSSQASDETTP
jgi:cell division protein FtsI/penicillin-binding protein 2